MATRGKITKIDLAYAAGLFDGEGHIIIYKDTNRKKQKTPVFILIVGITNTYRGVIDFFHKKWGACSQRRERFKNHPKWKTCYFWTIQSRMAMDFLKDILPYLTIKKEKAKLAIRFQEGMKRYKDRGKKFRQVPKKELQRRNYFWQKLNLHKK